MTLKILTRLAKNKQELAKGNFDLRKIKINNHAFLVQAKSAIALTRTYYILYIFKSTSYGFNNFLTTYFPSSSSTFLFLESCQLFTSSLDSNVSHTCSMESKSRRVNDQNSIRYSDITENASTYKFLSLGFSMVSWLLQSNFWASFLKGASTPFSNKLTYIWNNLRQSFLHVPHTRL